MSDRLPDRLLVVDDNQLSRDRLEGSLEHGDFIVETVASGPQALARLAQGGVDLVLLDFALANMDGVTVLHEIRKTHPIAELPVIMISGAPVSKEIVRALDVGASDYVTRPHDLPVIAARVRTHLALLHANRQLRFANHTIQELADRIQLIMDSATIAIFATDRDGTLVRVNETAADITGREVADLIGTPFVELFAEDSRKDMAMLIEQVATAGYFVTNHKARILRAPDDEERILNVSLRALGNGRHVSGAVGTAEDITGPRGLHKEVVELVDSIADMVVEPGPPMIPAPPLAEPPVDPGQAAASVNARTSRRRRAFKGAKISFNNDSSVMDAVVRDLSEGGAKLELVAHFNCPRFVRLRIHDGPTYDCEVRRFANRIMGLRFLKKL